MSDTTIDKPANYDEVVNQIKGYLGRQAAWLEFRWVKQITGYYKVVSQNIFVLMNGQYVASPSWDVLSGPNGPLVAAAEISEALRHYNYDKPPMEEPE